MKRWENLEIDAVEPLAKKANIEEVNLDLESEEVTAYPSVEEDVIVSIPDQLDQHQEVQILKGSVEDVIFIIDGDIKKDKGKNLFVLMDRVAVWVRYYASNTSLGWLKDQLLLLYRDNFLVSPTFSANNKILPHGKYL